MFPFILALDICSMSYNVHNMTQMKNAIIVIISGCLASNEIIPSKKKVDENAIKSDRCINKKASEQTLIVDENCVNFPSLFRRLIVIVFIHTKKNRF